eukprot:TRINITY_DN2242_c2_g1_i1.p2 TRINITY_DN2242_c2_g1~~TRINITY_DN2242_c2_g1_i1.p2  ORF type:complete len:100 (+),score=18.23 TRINITY_DN2242_c2_g1_i1:229-528(+)
MSPPRPQYVAVLLWKEENEKEKREGKQKENEERFSERVSPPTHPFASLKKKEEEKQRIFYVERISRRYVLPIGRLFLFFICFVSSCVEVRPVQGQHRPL